MRIDQYLGTITRGVVRLKDAALALAHLGTVPTPSSATRGGMYRVEGGAGVADTLVVIHKNAADAYTTKNLLATDAPVDAKYIVQTPDTTLTNEQALSSLATGIVKNTTTTGVLSIAVGADLPTHTHAEGDVTNLVTDLAAKAPVGAKYIVQQADATLTAEQSLGALATGILKSTTTSGVLSIAVGADLPTHTHAESDVTNLTTDLAAKAPVGAKYIVQQADATLTAEQSLGALATGILKSTTTTGVLSIAVGADLPTHTHAEADVTNLVTDLGNKATAGSALTESAEANSTPVAGGTNTAPGTGLRLYTHFQLPTTSKFFIITGIEWKNGGTVAGTVYSGCDIVNGDPPNATGTALAAVGRPASQSGTNAVQRVSEVASQPIRGGAFVGAWIQTDNATATFGNTTVSSANLRKSIAAVVPATVDFTAWTASTVEYYVKVYYRGYN